MSPKILICDDTPTVLDFLELVFEKQGFEVIRAGNGEYALAMAAEQHPDLLLVDAMMPGMDGFEICRRLRSNPATSSETILMYSAVVGEEVRARALSAGADEFLGKTLSHAELVSQVRDWLAARAEPGGVGSQAWVRVGLDLLTLFHSELVWLLEVGEEGAETLAAVSERGEQQAMRFVQTLGAGPYSLEHGGFLAQVLERSELSVGKPVEFVADGMGSASAMEALHALGIRSYSSAPLVGGDGRRGIVVFASPATLTLDRQAAEEIAIGLRYAEAALDRT
jgi:CheY-like chemotaxis protein